MGALLLGAWLRAVAGQQAAGAPALFAAPKRGLQRLVGVRLLRRRGPSPPARRPHAPLLATRRALLVGATSAACARPAAAP